ncbi:MAG TPA: DNA polymerase ligase N-terminal domain-containing protein [Gemmataceae bacterium]|nr:DNA polymerase ligase N-terminal domain-containing protein [Gemmataceae bacterium]
MPRFVILEHDHPTLHWDLMLEAGLVLRTWRLAKPPEISGPSIEASPLADHRVFYLDYEGPLSGQRGSVRRWDSGEYEPVAEIEGREIRIRLMGQRLHGMATLRVIDDRWLFLLDVDS